jgi:hypothetical protein
MRRLKHENQKWHEMNLKALHMDVCEYIHTYTYIHIRILIAQEETLEAKMTRDEFESLIGDLLQVFTLYMHMHLNTYLCTA